MLRWLKMIRHFSQRRQNDQKFKPVVLVTGCGSGIGWALAKMLYRIGRYRVVVTARENSISKMKESFVESDRFWIRQLDVTSEIQRKNLIDEINRHWGGVNVLINNAGISYRSVIEHMTEADEVLQMSTNYLGPIGLIRLVLPHMRELGRGKIICVSSVSGMLAMPTMASYSASKYALEGACEALWYECKPLGVDVSLVQPGFIRSRSFNKVYFSENSNPKNSNGGPYHDYYEHMTPFVEKMMLRSISNPQKVAKIILDTIQMERPPLWIPATLDAFGFYYLRRIFPRRWLLPVLFYCLPGARHWGKKYTKKREVDRKPRII
ncbi:MAG TPA: SDR family NAD(P)-dependent oxidoreductase [Bdellovibrio sp.]|nr:SDR family NAD(P)-dependent oxidoreductase [Bdellovibrio sp.]